MKKNKDIEQDFIIDKLTNSIENVVTGDSFQTEISVLTQGDLKMATKKKCIQAFQGTWLPLPVNFHFSADMKVMFPSFQKHC